MKKIVLLLAGVALAATSASAQKSFKPANTADSMGYYVGYTQGALTGSRIAEVAGDTDLDLYRSEFMRGVTQALLADTVNTGFADGMRVGAAMRDELIKLRNLGLPCNFELFNRTFAEQLNHPDTTKLPQYMLAVNELIQPVMQRQQDEELRRKQLAQQQYLDQAAANMAAGNAYIDSIKANVPDAKTTESGLVYRVIKEGEGPTLVDGQRGLIYYTGTLVDGTVFDSTEPGNPVQLGPTGVISGFGEGLKLMNKGARYIFYIPANLAYGMQGPPAIGPGQALIFDVEVTDIIE